MVTLPVLCDFLLPAPLFVLWCSVCPVLAFPAVSVRRPRQRAWRGRGGVEKSGVRSAAPRPWPGSLSQEVKTHITTACQFTSRDLLQVAHLTHVPLPLRALPSSQRGWCTYRLPSYSTVTCRTSSVPAVMGFCQTLPTCCLFFGSVQLNDGYTG